MASLIRSIKRFRRGGIRPMHSGAGTDQGPLGHSPHMRRDIGLTDVHLPHFARHHPLIVAHGLMFRFDR